MSVVRVTVFEQTVRVTPTPPATGTVVVRSSSGALVRVSEIGLQGPPGEPGPPGEADIPAILDGGNF